MKKATNFKNQWLFNLVGALGLELIFTFKLAFTLDTPTLPEQLKRPDSGRSDTVQSTLTVQFLDALLGSNCVVF